MLALLFVCALAIVLGAGVWRRRKARYPPGPSGLPLLGNALQVPRNDAWLQFSKWRGQYGPIVYVQLLHQPAVILNTHSAAIDLMTRRARLYSDRPWNYVAGKLLTGGQAMPFMDFNDRWRSMRHASQDGLRKSSVVRYRQLQRREACRAARSLLISPGQWQDHLLIAAASVIMSSVYGSAPTSTDDPNLHAVKSFTERLARAVYPGAYLVELLPWLRFVPAWAAPWKRDALQHYAADSAYFQQLFKSLRTDDPAFGSASSRLYTFGHSLLDKVDENTIGETDAAWLCAIMFTAGAETTYASLCWFILAMVLHKDVQVRAQAELDAVVGRARAPDFGDFDNLPYLNAVVKEVLRWRPPLPLGLPHRVSTGDHYNGYDLPRNTLCIPNIWEINRDVEVWGEDAADFRPGRHLSAQGKFSPQVLTGHDDSHVAFGFGRRICVGRHFAAETLTITCATILWACRISPPVDKDGHDLLPSDYAHTETGMTLHPVDFDCLFEPRVADVLEQMQWRTDIDRPSD